MNTRDRNGAPSELKRRSKKQIRFMISNLVEIVFLEIKSGSLISVYFKFSD